MPIFICLPCGKMNVIAFKDAPLSEVIKVLNRWYDVDFKIEDQSAWDVYFTITSENTLLEKCSSGFGEDCAVTV